jgi:hypothetical protein
MGLTLADWRDVRITCGQQLTISDYGTGVRVWLWKPSIWPSAGSRTEICYRAVLRTNNVCLISLAAGRDDVKQIEVYEIEGLTAVKMSMLVFTSSDLLLDTVHWSE